MAPKFKIKVFQISTFVKNLTIISIVTLSFLLVFFSKSDLYLINGIKNISSSVIIPITKVITAPINTFSNFVDEYNQFRSLKFENKGKNIKLLDLYTFKFFKSMLISCIQNCKFY